MSGKFALVIGNTEYTDSGLAQLTAPGKDAEDFARVLKDTNICAFDDVKVLLNQPEPMVREAVDEFFDQKKSDDLLVLYFSGHGVRDELGALYLAVKNTNRFRLRSTALKTDFIREAMDQSRSKRQVLILDCCNSGAFGQGMKAATGVSIGTATAFEAGYGRIILTASDSTQFAWEGNQVIGETDNSLFTHFLVEGLEGEADLDGDGSITVDELYDYAYDKVKLATPKQTPSKFSSKQQGEIVLRERMRIEDIKPASLPTALLDSLENPFSDVRLGAVQQLIKLLNGKNLGLARSAREALERIEKEDDSRTVSQAVTQVLEPIRQAEQLALQKAEEERLTAETLAAEQKAKEEAERLLAEQRAEEQRIAEEKRLAEAKAEAQRKAKEGAEQLLAEQKAEEERKAKKEAKRLAVVKAREERLTREKAEADRLAEEERLAAEKADAEFKAKKDAEQARREETQSFVTRMAEDEWLAREKADAERKAKEDQQRLVMQKAKEEAEHIAAWKTKAERTATEKAPIFLRLWILAITKPTVENYVEITQHSKPGTAFFWVGSVNFILYFIIYLIITISDYYSPDSSITFSNYFSILLGLLFLMLLSVVTLVLKAACIHWTSTVLGGQGSFINTLYGIAAFSAPFAIINIPAFVLSATILLSCLCFPVLLGDFLYMAYLNIVVAQAVYHLSRARAFIAGLVFPLIVVILIIGLGYVTWQYGDQLFRTFYPN